jgi:hypothetical protein
VSLFELAVRVSAALGSFDEVTWTAPGVELVARVQLGEAFVAASAGYVPIDSHVNLADGEIVRGAVSAGVQRDRVHVAGIFDLGYVAYHGDPDVLVKHPGVDLVAREGGITPSLGVEAGYRFTSTVSAGVFVRAALRELTVYDGGGDDVARARLILGGAFLEVRLH